MKNLGHIYAFAALAFFSISSSFAATRTWTGAVSTAWNNSSNWNNPGTPSVPSNGDDIVIPANLTNYPVLTLNITANTITLNGGSLDANNFNISTANDILINDGILDMGTGTLDIDEIDLNNGELIIQGNRIFLDDDGDELTINGGTLTVTGADLEINKDITLESGILDLNGYDMIVEGRYTYIDGYVLDPGDFIVNDITINFSGQHYLGINLRVEGSMSFTNGILTTDDEHFITFDYNASVSGADNQSHIVGPVRKEIRTSGTNTFMFPIGDGTYYAPLEISNYSNRRNQDYFTASYFPSRNINAGDSLEPGIDHVSQAEYWDLSRAATSGTPTTTVKVRLYYNENQNSGSVTSWSNLIVAHWNGTRWENEGRGSGSSTSNTSGYIASNGNISSYSPFTIGSTNSANPLPIVLLDFNAKALENSVNVVWKTAAEINNDYFNVEKSLDGINWTVISTVDGAGNTESISEYGIIDANPVNGIQYYRLKQVDVNGQFEYSSIVPVKFAGLANKINLFPSPATTTLNISINNDENAEVVVNIYNSLGQIVMTANTQSSNLSLDIANLTAGVYVVEISCEGETTQSRLIKN